MAAGTGWQTRGEGVPGQGIGAHPAPAARRPLPEAWPARPKSPRLLGLEVSGGAGRFQPQPIFGESLSRLRHPAPGGGGDGGGPRIGLTTAGPPPR